MIRKPLLGLLGVAITATLGLAPLWSQDPPRPAGSAPSPPAKADPKDSAAKELPVQIRLSGKTRYVLNTGGLDSDAYKKKIAAAAEAGRPLPTPAVDIVVEIVNTSSKPIDIWTSGDPVVLTLDLQGPGAWNLNPPLAFTREFRAPQTTTLAAGKSVSFRLSELTSGFRGRSRFCYWTQPGDYELQASFKTAIRPAPPGSPDAGDGFRHVTLTSAPLKISVGAK